MMDHQIAASGHDKPWYIRYVTEIFREWKQIFGQWVVPGSQNNLDLLPG